MKRLIVNADDFGMTAGVNRAVAEAHRRGIVTSTSLMATGVAFDDAVASLARRTVALGWPALAPGSPTLAGDVADNWPAPAGFASVGQRGRLSVGCHVVLLEGTPLLPPEQTPRLAVRAPDGTCRYQRTLGKFIGAATTGRLAAEEIVREASAQIRKLQSAGIAVSHLDTHKHAHVFPEVFRPLMRAAVACGIRAMRNPFEPPQAMPWAAVLFRPALWLRYLPVRTLRVFAAEFRRQAAYYGIATPDGTIGITLTGFLDESLLFDLLQGVPDGTWELCCHPAYEDAAWRALGTRPGSGLKERELFASPFVRRRIEALGIELISYAGLTQETQTAAA